MTPCVHLNCGCMKAHDDMGQPDVNITYEDVKRAADANGMTVQQVLDIIGRTVEKDRAEHPREYAEAAAGPASR